ncbi:MAG: cytochrome c oxidase assembly protein [Alphaproteobacteria bacterium]|nr:cytochrome c oxidase assembly protein [Alphaproteobacteria bacterium]
MTRRPRALTVVVLLGIVVGMAGLVVASVPLYRMFCAATGYGGTPRIASVASAATPTGSLITVRFNADTDRDMPWEFHPAQTEMRVALGEPVLAVFKVHNPTSRTITGAATFNVTPDKVGSYVSKLQCFCFSRQTLGPDERADLPVSFVIDPALARDPDTREVTTITLSYTFFRAMGDNTPIRPKEGSP